MRGLENFDGVLKQIYPRQGNFEMLIFRHYENKTKIFFMKLVNPFHASLFRHPLKTKGFLMFSGGIDRDQWHEMGVLERRTDARVQ